MFRTELVIPPSNFKIDHRTKLVTIGSCFSQVIGERLLSNKFEVQVNPFGTVFNPISIFKLIGDALSGNTSLFSDSVENKGVWFNHHIHSEFYGNSKEELDSKITHKLRQLGEHLLKTDAIIITLGTAFVYKLKSNNEIVANCHKQLSANFVKELLTVDEIVEDFVKFYDLIKSKSLKVKFILTVSPVRHTKDTIELNSVSKSILRLACHELSQRFPDVFYFPSYEIMMDDLRDYRFYKEDMIHPTEVAEDYIWNKFSETYIEIGAREIIKEWSSIRKALQHKPFREDSEEYRRFLSDILKKMELLRGKINLEEEVNIILSKL